MAEPTGLHNPAHTGAQETKKITYRVGASDYGGPSDPSSGHKGYHGDTLDGKMAYAELGMGTLLGNLPYRTKLVISYGGRSVIAEKLDIGLGGAPVQGHARRIDLWYQTAQALGFNGTGLVDIQKPDGFPILGPSDVRNADLGAVGTGLLGIGVGPDVGTEASEKVKGAVEGIASWTAELSKILNFIGSSSGWVRIGKVVLGAGLLMIAITELTKISPEASTAVDPVKKAAGFAAKNVR